MRSACVFCEAPRGRSRAARSAPGRLLSVPLALLMVAAGRPVSAQTAAQSTGTHDPRVTTANYRLGARFAPYKIQELVKSTTVRPTWIQGSDRFWYEWETTEGRFFYLVDPASGTKRQIFDNDRIAAELTRITRDPWDGQHLPIRDIRFIDQNTLQFEAESSQEEEAQVEVETEEDLQQRQQRQERQRRRGARKKIFHFEYDVRTQTLRLLEDWEAPDRHPDWAGMSPDSAWVVYNRECNLYLMTAGEYRKILDARRGKSGEEADSAEMTVDVEETRLTTDGEMHYCYGSYGRGENDEETRENWGKRQSARVLWSHDSRYFAMTRQDERSVGDLWVVHAVGNERPQLQTYKYPLPGEESVAQTELLVFDMATRQMSKIDDQPWKDQRMGIFHDPESGRGYELFYDDRRARGDDREESPIRRWLSDRSDQVYFWRRSRDQHRIDVLVANPSTGEVRVVIEERLNTYVEHQPLRRLAGGDLLWWSEQDGWAHLYRYGADGTLKARLTEGPWHVEEVEAVDQERGLVFFTANGREEGEDPYYEHLYRVGLDGRGLQPLNPGDFDHRVNVSKSNHYFIDNYSRVNTTPAAALYDTEGRRILDLEEADLSLLMAAGYRFPEPYRVKAADGITDLYGVMYRPIDFDASKKYPIVAYVYPGPQQESVSKSFSTNANEVGLAQFGFIVITIGNRGGNPARSKWYHNYGYGSLRDYGLADKKAAVEQLADRHAFVDIDRVGIYGHSGGGFMSTAAMLVYPDFFKVAVSSSGNHDNDVYHQNWSEMHHGIKEITDDEGNVTFEYDIEKNSELAENLKGHLLLTTGDVDDNVHHAGTFRMAEALIRANKRFDLFVFPGQRHGYRGQAGDYWYWLRAEYFVRHLLGDDRWEVDITQLNVEREQTGETAAETDRGEQRRTRR